MEGGGCTSRVCECMGRGSREGLQALLHMRRCATCYWFALHPIPCSCPPSCIPPPPPSRLPRAQNQTQVRHDAPFVAQAALLPPLWVLLPIQNLLACNLLSSGTLLRGELTSECKQTNKATTKQRSRDAVDPDKEQLRKIPIFWRLDMDSL